METEIWKQIPNYPWYYASTEGRIRSVGRLINGVFFPGIIHSHDPKLNDYLHCTLSNEYGKKAFSIHRIIAAVFIPNPENKPHINHLNGIKTDNRIINLEWCTPKENGRHAFDSGLSNNRYKFITGELVQFKLPIKDRNQ